MRSAIAAALLACGLTAPVAAQDAQGDAVGALSAIREDILYARYDEASTAAQALLNRADLTAGQRNAALELLATAYIANGAQAEATRTLRRLYSRDPHHRPFVEDASPRVQAAFARVRETEPPPVTVSMNHQTPALRDRAAPLLEVDIAEGADAVEEVRLSYRQGGDEEFSSVVMSLREGHAQGRVPVLTEMPEAYEVEYFITAQAPSDAVLARLGSETAPLSVTVPPRAPDRVQIVRVPGDPQPQPPAPDDGGTVFETWWFWTIVGAVVAGGVAAFIFLGPPSEGPVEGNLGFVELM